MQDLAGKCPGSMKQKRGAHRRWGADLVTTPPCMLAAVGLLRASLEVSGGAAARRALGPLVVASGAPGSGNKAGPPLDESSATWFAWRSPWWPLT